MFKRKADICMEIKDDFIRYVELKSLDPIIVRQYGEKPIPKNLIDGGRIIDMVGFKEFIEGCMIQWKLRNRNILFVEPDETVAIKIVNVPLGLDHEEMREYLIVDFGERISLPFINPAIDYVKISETTKEQKILLVGTPENLVTSYAKVFRENKLKPVAADISPLCIYRLYLDQMRNGYLPDQLMILQVNTLNVTISILEKHVPVFMQTEQLFTKKKAWKDNMEMAVDMQERLSDLTGEIKRILNLYKGTISEGNDIREIILVGGNPFLESLRTEIEQSLNVAIKTIPETIPSINGKPVPQKYYLAIGLGLKGVEYHVSGH